MGARLALRRRARRRLIGAIVLALGAPTLAAWVAGSDRRRLLAFWLVWYGVGHLLCALAPNYAALVVLRTVSLLGAAVYTPQAGAAIGVMTRPEARSGAITFASILIFHFCPL